MQYNKVGEFSDKDIHQVWGDLERAGAKRTEKLSVAIAMRFANRQWKQLLDPDDEATDEGAEKVAKAPCKPEV